MKILILKPSSLGDVVQALPVLRLLKQHEPRHQIYWWLAAELADLLQGDPDLSGIYLFERKRWAYPRYWPEMFQSVQQMRQAQFDLVIDLQGLARSGMVAWLSRPALSIGVEDWREGAPGFYDMVVPRPSRLTHAVDWYLQVAKKLGVPTHPDFTWIPERPATAAEVKRKWNPASARWMAVNPGARWMNKRWPIEFYCESVRRLGADYPDLRFVILGGTSDRELGRAIAQVSPDRCLDLTGKTTLAELVEWIRLCELILTNDTGPMHIAAALDKPVVAIFGPTEPRRTGPYGQTDRALRVPLACAPCLKPRCGFVKPMECMRAVTPSMACEEVSQWLQGGLSLNRKLVPRVD